VRGIVGSIPDAQSISAALSDERCLDDVKIKSTSQAIGTDRQKYVMEFDLKCPEDIRATTKKKKGDTSSSASSASGAPSSGGK
jgi:general secretion pathway protein L